MAAARSPPAGGGPLQTLTNTAGGTVFSGGTAQTPTPKNARAPAAQSTWVNGGVAIVSGTTRLVRNSVGFAQTGGTGGLQPIMQQAALQMDGGTTPNPVHMQFSLNTVPTAVAFEMKVEKREEHQH